MQRNAALAALLLLAACGPHEGRGLAVVGEARLGAQPECFSLSCADPALRCSQLFFDYGRSPPLCVESNICDRLTCAIGQCTVFDGLPLQVKCIQRD